MIRVLSVLTMCAVIALIMQAYPVVYLLAVVAVVVILKGESK